MDKIGKYSSIVNELRSLSESDERIRGCFIFGSRAQSESYADGWSDLDVSIICKNPDSFIKDSSWLKNFGGVILNFKEAVSLGVGIQIRVLFEGFNDVDFSFFSPLEFHTILKDQRFSNGVIGRGILKVVDKDTLFDFIKESKFTKRYYTPDINNDILINNADDFLFHAVNAIKKLHKNEILTAKETLDISMKNILVLFIRWQAMSKNKKIDTWHRNRHFEKWADSKYAKELECLYSGYNKYDIYEKTITNIQCFNKLVQEVCELNGLNYQFEKFNIVLKWINENKPE